MVLVSNLAVPIRVRGTTGIPVGSPIAPVHHHPLLGVYAAGEAQPRLREGRLGEVRGYDAAWEHGYFKDIGPPIWNAIPKGCPAVKSTFGRPMARIIVVGRTSGCEVQSERRRRTGVAGVMCCSSPGSTAAAESRRTEAELAEARQARENKSLGQSSMRPITGRARARPHLRVSTEGGLSFAGPQSPSSRSPVATQDEGAALVGPGSSPSKTNLLVATAIRHPPRTKAQPNRIS